MQYKITKGKREGYIDVAFEEKPEEGIRTRLKKAGFRWSPRYQVWYGLADRFPLGNPDALEVPEETIETVESLENLDRDQLQQMVESLMFQGQSAEGVEEQSLPRPPHRRSVKKQQKQKNKGIIPRKPGA